MPAATRPKLLLFDLSDLVLEGSPEARWRALGSLTGMPADRVRRALADSGFLSACRSGRLRGEAELRDAGRALGMRLTMAAYRRCWIDGMTPRPEVIALIHRAKAHFPTALFWNAGGTERDAFEAALPEIAALFLPRIASADLGVCKPDPRAFAAALNLVGLEAGEVGFIDAATAHTDTAAALGFAAHTFTDTARLEATLDAWAAL